MNANFSRKQTLKSMVEKCTNNYRDKKDSTLNTLSSTVSRDDTENSDESKRKTSIK